jgi:hypothetical protein
MLNIVRFARLTIKRHDEMHDRGHVDKGAPMRHHSAMSGRRYESPD